MKNELQQRAAWAALGVTLVCCSALQPSLIIKKHSNLDAMMHARACTLPVHSIVAQR
jgi:hypothetical protein